MPLLADGCGYSSFLGFPATEGNGRRGLSLRSLQAVGRQARLTRMETASLSSAPSSSSAPALSGFCMSGLKFRHDRFGEGEVTAIEGEGGNAKATVSFAHFGQKQLLLKFARLTIVE